MSLGFDDRSIQFIKDEGQASVESASPEDDGLSRILDKIGLDRLRDKGLRITLLCPYCKSTRLSLDGSKTTEGMEGIDCPKCGAHVMLDSMSIVVIKEAAAAPRP
ncbi:MAG: hypothetical protein A3K68_00490 [Euryarchaeota archaeon RBG_16_68_13]|nr:MAG: hypothetical protein A3K68_00490 [Euryarchaeota archaeon RBG_16_68_13]